MQSPSSSVSSGNISPAIVGSDKGTKEVYIVGGMVLIVAVAIGAGWHYSGQGQSHVSKTPAEALSNTQVTNVLKTGTNPLAEPILHNQIVPASSYKSDSIHTDIYFEVGRKGLTDDAKTILATQADLAKNDPDLGILVQGYTDQQGSVSYNHKLGLMRAEKVKEFLVGQGVSDQVIKVVSLGKDGALCLDSSDVCRNMNRRVHLEIRKIGQEHMILPTVATELKTSEPIQSANDQGTNTDGHGSLADTLLPSLADPSATDPSPLGTDLASGSYPATSLTLEETESLPGSGQPTESFTLSRFALPRSTMLYARARSSVVRLCLGVLLTVFPPLVSPTATLLAQPAESFSTAVIPTMGINDVTEGTLLLKTNQRGRYIPAPILKTDVQIAVTGIIARATVRQEFTNPNQKKGDWLEGIYVFPLPETAAVDHLRMHVGDRIIEGQIKERGEAKKVYEKAKQEGKRTSLVEQERPNVFTTSVANIGPGERIIVEIEYQETVRYDQGTFQLRFPMAIGQRYIPGTPVIVEDQDPNGSGTMLDTDRVPDASRITPPVQAPGQGSINPVSLTLSLTPGFPIAKVESLFHQVIVIPDPDGGYHISLKKDAVPADRDFQLTWSPAPSTEPAATILTEQRDGEAYVMLMLVPPTQQHDTARHMPRDLTFIIDTSGSMADPSIEQAKASLVAALTTLTTQDRVNVIQFNHTVRSLYSSPQPVTTAAMRKAIRYVEGLSADGGTEMLPALRQALKNPQDSTRLQQIVLITDGQVGNEDELFVLLHHHLGTRRVFTIRIGSTPNSHLMRKTAEIGRGAFTYVGNVSEVKNKLDALFKKLERPVLNDIQLDRTGWAGLEHYPSSIADLYEGEPAAAAILWQKRSKLA